MIYNGGKTMAEAQHDNVCGWRGLVLGILTPDWSYPDASATTESDK